MHLIWIILISAVISIIVSIIICKIISREFKYDPEIERQLIELKKIEKERKHLECLLIDILERSPFIVINKQKSENLSEDTPEDDSSTEW